MASFSFSVSDIAILANLVTQTYRGWKNVCGTYTEITGELRMMRTIVARLEKEVKSSSSLLRRDEKESSDLRHILTNSQATVSQLNDILVKYRHVDRSRKHNWNRLRFGNENLKSLCGRLTLHVSELSTHLQESGISSLGRIELETLPKMMKTFDELAAAVRADRGEGSIMTAHSNDNRALWREFRRELIMEGFSSKEIHRHKQKLKDYLRKLAESGSLEEKAPRSPSDEAPYSSSDEAQSVVDNIFDERVEQLVGPVLHVKDNGTGSAETQEKDKLKSTMTADDDKSARIQAETTMLNRERESERESGEIGIESRRICDPPEDTQDETPSSLSSFSPGSPLEGPEPLYDPCLLKMQMQLKAAIRYQKAAKALEKTRGESALTGGQLIRKRDLTPSLSSVSVEPGSSITEDDGQSPNKRALHGASQAQDNAAQGLQRTDQSKTTCHEISENDPMNAPPEAPELDVNGFYMAEQVEEASDKERGAKRATSFESGVRRGTRFLLQAFVEGAVIMRGPTPDQGRRRGEVSRRRR